MYTLSFLRLRFRFLSVFGRNIPSPVQKFVSCRPFIKRRLIGTRSAPNPGMRYSVLLALLSVIWLPACGKRSQSISLGQSLGAPTGTQLPSNVANDEALPATPVTPEGDDKQILIQNFYEAVPVFVTVPVVLPAPPGTEPTLSSVDEKLDLYFTGNYNLNWGGQNEKWIRGRVEGASEDVEGWYYLLPNGELRLWYKDSPNLEGALVASFSPSVYTNPRELTDAFVPTLASFSELVPKLGFYQAASDSLNWGGKNERWFKGRDSFGDHWYFVTPDGKITRWYEPSGTALLGNPIAYAPDAYVGLSSLPMAPTP